MQGKSIFYNEFGRFRSGWRFSIFLLSFFFASIVLVLAAGLILSALPVGFAPRSLAAFLLQFGVMAAVAVFFGWYYGKIFEDLPFRALGCWFTEKWFKNLVLGLLCGAAALGLAVLLASSVGGFSFQINQTHGATTILTALATSLLIFVFGAAFEEAFFRGYLLQTLSRAKLFRVGLLLTSVLFAAAHNNNPGASAASWGNTFLAGIWLAVAYFKTRDLWFPFGIHLTWNWFQGSILGINVSGLAELASAPVFQASENGPAWLTGGDYGVEGGAACTAALIVSTVLIYFSPFLKPSAEMLTLTSGEKTESGSQKAERKKWK